MAEKRPTVSGEHTTHSPLPVNCAVGEFGEASVNMRSCGSFAAVCSCSKFFARLTCIAMFDWPEPSQTSPTSTSEKVTVFWPLTVSVCGPAAASGASFTDHLPSAPAFAVAVWPAIVTVTSSPGAAVPHTGTAVARWSTMWLPKMAGSFTSARAAMAKA